MGHGDREEREEEEQEPGIPVTRKDDGPGDDRDRGGQEHARADRAVEHGPRRPVPGCGEPPEERVRPVAHSGQDPPRHTGGSEGRRGLFRAEHREPDPGERDGYERDATGGRPLAQERSGRGDHEGGGEVEERDGRRHPDRVRGELVRDLEEPDRGSSGQSEDQQPAQVHAEGLGSRDPEVDDQEDGPEDGPEQGHALGRKPHAEEAHREDPRGAPEARGGERLDVAQEAAPPRTRAAHEYP